MSRGSNFLFEFIEMSGAWISKVLMMFVSICPSISSTLLLLRASFQFNVARLSEKASSSILSRFLYEKFDLVTDGTKNLSVTEIRK